MQVLARGWVAVASGLMMGVATIAARQDPSPPARPQATFAARAQGVLVDVEVTKGGRPYAGAKAEDFEVRDNGVLQEVDVVHSENAPINAVLALDASASTSGQRLKDLLTASRTLVDDLKPGDHAGLTTFNQRVAPRVPLTTDLDRLRTALTRIEPSGDTALLDGLYAGLLSTQPAIGASLVVVYTDGGDTASWLDQREVLDTANRLNAVVDAVVIRSTHKWPELKAVVDTTGGHAVVIDSTAGLAAEFARILAEFRNRYQVTFIPRGVEPSGFHKLEIKVKGSGLTVRARNGYLTDNRDK
jgi:VWFA-related protein